MFRFKQFSIQQENTAMKVGTDGVLLGAWTPLQPDIDTVLDVGTGTGLIALMLAQRHPLAQIDALEIEEEAFLEAQQNFERSKWFDRLTVHHLALQNYQTEKKYDLIVSNPPYYMDGLSVNNSKRLLARHVGDLSFEILIKQCVALMSNQGRCSFIIPFQSHSYFIELAQSNGLYPLKITHVKGNTTSPYKRSLMLFSKQELLVEKNTLTLELERHCYTQEYISLTQDFYLKM